MWSRNRTNTGLQSAAIVLALVVGGAGLVPTISKAMEIEKTPERLAICETAEERYQELYPDAEETEGVVVVKLYKYTFCPLNLTVKKGTTVRWVNVDKRTSHSVWLKDAGLEESERFFPEEIWEHTFTEDGAYPYLCGPHWKDEDMRGFVKVTP